jgi:hypothetical protein
MQSQSIGGAKYYVMLADDFSRKIYVYFLKYKLDVSNTFKKFKAMVENESA